MIIFSLFFICNSFFSYLSKVCNKFLFPVYVSLSLIAIITTNTYAVDVPKWITFIWTEGVSFDTYRYKVEVITFPTVTQHCQGNGEKVEILLCCCQRSLNLFLNTWDSEIREDAHRILGIITCSKRKNHHWGYSVCMKEAEGPSCK